MRRMEKSSPSCLSMYSMPSVLTPLPLVQARETYAKRQEEKRLERKRKEELERKEKEVPMATVA